MEEASGEAVSLSTGKGKHSGTAPQAGPTPQHVLHPNGEKTPGKRARRVAKVTAALSTKKKETLSLQV